MQGKRSWELSQFARKQPNICGDARIFLSLHLQGHSKQLFDEFLSKVNPYVPDDSTGFDGTIDKNEGITTINDEQTTPSLTFSVIGHDADCGHMRIIDDDTPIQPRVRVKN